MFGAGTRVLMLVLVQAVPQGACVGPIAQDLTQAAWVLPANASLPRMLNTRGGP